MDDSRCGPGCDCRAISRRAFIGAAALNLAGSRVTAGPFEQSEYVGTAPQNKRLDPAWVRGLFSRGNPTAYRGTDLDLIGMPVGGIGAGQVYLGGDGRLWRWDIFNEIQPTGDAHYAHPPVPDFPLDQGFSLTVTSEGRTVQHPLDRSGFTDIRFTGQYPIGTVDYRDPNCPADVRLEAFSPFIPTETDDSSLPVIALDFTVKNVSSSTATVTLSGWLENAVCLNNRAQPGTRRNRIFREDLFTWMECTAEPPVGPLPSPRPDVVFENWSNARYEGWTVEGTAFGDGPVQRTALPPYQGEVGGEDERVVNSHASAPGEDVSAKDRATGRLTSRPFRVDRRFIRFWIGGGAHRGRTCLNLLIDGKPLRTATGRNDNKMAVQFFDVSDFQGREARLEVVDQESGGWGNIGLGRITFTDEPPVSGPLESLPDFGDMGLALLGKKADVASAHFGRNPDSASAAEAAGPLSGRLTGVLGRRMRLAPGQSRHVTFLLAWRFPNLELPGLGKVGRQYARRFQSARAAARYAAREYDRLARFTRLWRDTWYGGSLPWWFLDRTHLTICALATSTSYRFADGRFYGWEGVGCCHGTCTHVWHYAQAAARLFPSLERETRERVDLGLAFHPDSGVIGFRAEFDRGLAVDGQAGTILRVYREHQMSADAGFLRRNWSRVKQALEPLFHMDPDEDGVLEGAQMNTLDQPWFGRVSWLSSLYLAALQAGSAMAHEMGDSAFGRLCSERAARGSRNLDSTLFNGEYYAHVPDQAHARTVGSHNGCEIDQVLGESWSRQLALIRSLPKDHVRSALGSLWKYNFAPDVGPFRTAHRPGRWYAMPGEGGLLMCSWPKGESARVSQGFDYYFNECMTGFEYQAAAHMIWEGMVQEGFAVVRAIHERYHASRRNPWNEVECGDHYARSMASYGAYLAACGAEYHGPRGHFGFAPAITAEAFQCAFTAAEGWGRFSQRVEKGRHRAEITILYGGAKIKSLALELPETVKVNEVIVRVGRRALPAVHSLADRRLTITLTKEAVLVTGSRFTAEIV